MNVKRQLYKKYRLAGFSGYAAAIKAGYSRAYAKNATIRLDKGGTFTQALEIAGLTDTALAQHAQEGLNANKVISANIIYGDADEKTNDFIEVPDWQARHRYFKTILEIMKKVSPTPNIQVNQFTQIFQEMHERAQTVDINGRVIREEIITRR